MAEIVVIPGNIDSTAAAVSRRASLAGNAAGNLAAIASQTSGATGDPACDEALISSLSNLATATNANSETTAAMARALRANAAGYVGADNSSAAWMGTRVK